MLRDESSGLQHHVACIQAVEDLPAITNDPGEAIRDLNTPRLTTQSIDKDVLNVVEWEAFELSTQSERAVIGHRWQCCPRDAGVL